MAQHDETFLTMSHTLHHATTQYIPGIDLDEVERDRVLARRQFRERLLDVVFGALRVETTTDVPKRAALLDFSTIPALKTFGLLNLSVQDVMIFSLHQVPVYPAAHSLKRGLIPDHTAKHAA